MEYVSRETCSGLTPIEYNVSRETFNQNWLLFSEVGPDWQLQIIDYVNMSKQNPFDSRLTNKVPWIQLLSKAIQSINKWSTKRNHTTAAIDNLLRKINRDIMNVN